MKRLGNLRTQKGKEVSTRATLNLNKGKSNIMTLSQVAASKLGIEPGDRVDMLEGDAVGEFFITKSVNAATDDANEALPKEVRVELPGRKVSKTLSFTSTSIHPLLKALGTSFEISDQTTEFEGLRWNRLIIASEKEAISVDSTARTVKSNNKEVVQEVVNDEFK